MCCFFSFAPKNDVLQYAVQHIFIKILHKFTAKTLKCSNTNGYRIVKKCKIITKKFALC